MIVKSPLGLCDETSFDKIVLQGDTWGPTMASNQVDTVGKQLLEELPSYIYKYKGYVPVGILGMIDDVAGVSESGTKATELNSFINVKSAEKKLQFGPDKCNILTIAHKNANIVENSLYIDYWSETHDKNDNLIETFEGKIEMKNVNEQKYLGFVLSADGSNMKNIQEKQKRAIGIRKDITFLLQGLGKYTFEVGMIYLNSLLRSSILFAAEAMYSIKEKEYRLLERIEEEMLRHFFKTERGCPIYQLYFESGVVPARFQIKRMKLVFYHYILNQKENSLIFTFLKAQKSNPRRGDWYSEVQQILKEFEINLTEIEIKETQSMRFKALVKKSYVKAAIKYLNSLQKKKEKGALIRYESLELQDYLNSSANLKIEEQRFIFSLRSEMNPLKSNFKRNHKMEAEFCLKKCGKELNNEHLVWCSFINEDNEHRYNDILNGDLQDKIMTLKQIQKNEEIRKEDRKNEKEYPCDPVNSC